MAVTSGFFNSSSGDRRYTAEQFGTLFEGIITDGVFSGVGQALRVEANGSTVRIGSGRAWCQGTWLNNDGELSLSAPSNSHPNYSRYDAVVLEFNWSESVRANSIKYISGTSAATPKRPDLVLTSLVRQMPLCYIFRPAGATTVQQGQIEMATGTSACPWITGPLRTLDISAFISSASSALNNATTEASKTSKELQTQLTKLQAEGEALKNRFNQWITDTEKLLGNTPNMNAIIEAKKAAVSAAADAKTAQQQAASAASTVAGYKSRLDAVETNANKVPALEGRVQVLENSPAGSAPVGVSRNYYVRPERGKTHTTPPTGWFQDIALGKFEQFAIGDKIQTSIGGETYIWRVAAFDYFYQLNVPKHHIVLVADTPIYTGAMSTASVMNGYSEDKTLLKKSSHNAITALASQYGVSGSAFWFDEPLSSAINSDGKATNAITVHTRFLDMTETMVFGHVAWGTSTRFDSGSRDDQLPLFRLLPETRKLGGGAYWLRNFFSSPGTIMMGVDADGRPDGWSVTESKHRRPIVLLGT
jgi:hypothetical protein|nr:MAG TPA: Receptor Binding Protein [Caudoviricetes sp.]